MKKILVIIGVVFIILLGTSLVLSLFSSKKTTFPTFQFLPTPTPVSGAISFPQNQISSPFEKTTIDVTTEEEVKKIEGVTATDSAGTDHVYTLPSVNALISDEVWTDGEKVIYEKTSTYTSNQGGFPSLSDYLKPLGQPEQTIQGNNFYGQEANSYLFPSKGIVLVGNPNTDETYEVQRFMSLSLLEYLRLHGETVKSDQQQESL